MMLRLLVVTVFLASLAQTAANIGSSDTSLAWPWGKHNNNTKPSTSCTTYTSCSTCSDESWCHWCKSDESCHVMGSIHGCVSGSNCLPPPPPKNDTSGCAAHSSCSECDLSSHTCHWCAHDNACHAVGSVYGCVTGVDCYSNDRCKRSEPELIDHITFTQMGFVPMVFTVCFGFLLACCTSVCMCFGAGIKGAYDDLLLSEATQQPLIAVSSTTTTTNPAPQEPVAVEQADEEENNEEAAHEYVRLVDAGSEDEETPVSLPRPRQRKSMQRMYNACVGCYIGTLLLVACSVVTTMRLYPKIPQYNVCNDSMAWQSIMDSLTHLKVTADFEILISISNPNHFDAKLEMGHGSFTHEGAFVGTFDIPPVVVKSMSITDMMIIAHFSPDRWDALGLVAEYTRGKLVLHVDAQATISVPLYSFSTELRDIVVHVNEMSDRHLCSCPDWSSAKNHSMPALPAV
jgi:hypothetical protein